jgi:hypothetical protein
MIAAQYLIISSGDGQHNRYGDVLIVAANPVKNNGWLTSVNECECSETEYFFFPNDNYFAKEVLAITQCRELWKPNKNDFVDEQCRDECTSRMRLIHIHNAIVEQQNRIENAYFEMKYTVQEVIYGKNDTHRFDKEQEWTLSNELIDTPYGLFDIEGVRFVEEGPLVGLEFKVDGSLSVDDLPGYNGKERDIYIESIAIVRQPNNAWLWGYFMDEEGETIVTFCGYDNLFHGLAEYVQNFKTLFENK